MRIAVVVLAILTVLLALTGMTSQPADSGASPAAEHQAAPDHDGAASQPAAAHDAHGGGHDGDVEKHYVPRYVWVAPFVIILLCIAILPLIPATEHWWHKNMSKLKIAILLAAIVCIYYITRTQGFHHYAPGLATLGGVLKHAVIDDYIPFIVLLFALYTISGGIHLKGDLPAHPLTNTAFLAIGAAIASFIGTTGASMVLIRPLLKTNSERKNVKHTVIFFIFLVSNIGGCLLPIGDPPLFLGYLRGVPFLWTFHLVWEWAFVCAILLVIYFIWDSILYKSEAVTDIRADEGHVEPLSLQGKLNFVWLLGVVFSVALLVPGSKPFGGNWVCPPFLRELAQLLFAAIAWVTTQAKLREANKFDFFAIAEVACLFIGIFITMQVPVEILNAVGPKMASSGLDQPWHFFWLTGGLSSFLDNAPTYVVYFETAKTMPIAEGVAQLGLAGGAHIAVPMLVAISLGAVFMGANTYIGNGPNFMVKSIAEQSGVPMPSFFGYMLYSVLILIPVFVIVTFVFLV